MTVHAVPEVTSHPDHPAKTVFGVAVRTTVVPETNAAKHGFPVQDKPAGELVTVPVPGAVANCTVNSGPVPVKQTTLAVMLPITIAFEPLPLAGVVAVTTALPQASPVAVSRPVEFTVTICGVFDDHVTSFVRSLVPGG